MSNWRSSAACIGLGDEFFPSEPSKAMSVYAITRLICDACPVKAECLADALAHERGVSASGRAGMWGGLTPEQRWKVDRQVTGCTSEPVRRDSCGSWAGVTAHRRHGERACGACNAFTRNCRNDRNNGRADGVCAACGARTSRPDRTRCRACADAAARGVRAAS